MTRNIQGWKTTADYRREQEKSEIDDMTITETKKKEQGIEELNEVL